MMKGFISLLDETDAYSLGLKIIEDSGIKRDINSDNSIENLSKRENIQELLAAINTFVENTIESEGHTKNATLDRYLSEVALLTDADTKQDDSEQVTLMTIHSAKGLEFETVFIVGMEDEIFPGASASFSSKEMEEERRLFYVALTRAKSLCFIRLRSSQKRTLHWQERLPAVLKDSKLFPFRSGVSAWRERRPDTTPQARRQKSENGSGSLPKFRIGILP